MEPDCPGIPADRGPVQVGHHGGAAADRLAADDRCAPRAVEGDPAVASVDCLLVEWDACEAPAAAITSAADAGVPVVVCDPDGRPRRATRATRAGATEYLVPSALDGETVADRVVRVAVDDPGTDGPALGIDAPPVAGRSDLARLFDGLPDAVVDAEFVDREPVVRSVNNAFEELFGYDAAEVRGEPVDELLVPEEYADEAERIDRQARSDGHSINEVERGTTIGRRTFLFVLPAVPT
jgi:PAS domain S-box-containing protein